MRMSAEGHPSHEVSGPIYSVAGTQGSQGTTPTASSSTAVKKGRGKAKCKDLSIYVDKNGPINLNIPHNHRTPVGNNASWFASKVGEIVCNMCELHHDEWSSVPTEEKARLLCHIRSYFDLHMDMYEHTSAIKNKLGRAYARIRSNLHRKNYKKHFVGIDANKAEAIAKAKNVAWKTVPKGYQIDQWKQICDSFDKESWKTKSVRNKRNKSYLQTNHTSGTRSFINFIYKREQETRVKPNRLELYEYTHKKKDGEFVTPRCRALFKKQAV